MELNSDNSIVLEKTRELCQAILDQPDFPTIRQQVDAFLADEAIRTQYQELTDRGALLQHKQQTGAPLDASKMLSQRMQTQDLEALAKVIETSATDPQPLPDAEEIEPRLQPIYAHLMEEYGEAVQLLANPAAVKAEADKRKVCAIVGSMYDRILALPAQESGKMLRFMLKST